MIPLELGIYMSFTCDLNKATWIHEPLFYSDINKLQIGSKLLIHRLEYDHSGTFVCHGSSGNNDRLIIDEISIIVYGK